MTDLLLVLPQELVMQVLDALVIEAEHPDDEVIVGHMDELTGITHCAHVPKTRVGGAPTMCRMLCVSARWKADLHRYIWHLCWWERACRANFTTVLPAILQYPANLSLFDPEHPDNERLWREHKAYGTVVPWDRIYRGHRALTMPPVNQTFRWRPQPFRKRVLASEFLFFVQVIKDDYVVATGTGQVRGVADGAEHSEGFLDTGIQLWADGTQPQWFRNCCEADSFSGLRLTAHISRVRRPQEVLCLYKDGGFASGSVGESTDFRPKLVPGVGESDGEVRCKISGSFTDLDGRVSFFFNYDGFDEKDRTGYTHEEIPREDAILAYLDLLLRCRVV